MFDVDILLLIISMSSGIALPLTSMMIALKYDDLSDFADVSILRFGVLLVVFFSMRELL